MTGQPYMAQRHPLMSRPHGGVSKDETGGRDIPPAKPCVLGEAALGAALTLTQAEHSIAAGCIHPEGQPMLMYSKMLYRLAVDL